MKSLKCVIYVGLSLFSFNSFAEKEVAKLMHIEKSSIGWEARATVRIPSDIPLRSWVNCNYYDKNWEVLASTNHVLKERVPTWTVKSDYKKIKFVTCFKSR
mgnify:CR=1 FL=1